LPLLTGIAVLALAHAFDYLSFLAMIARYGLQAELNPLVILMAENVGLPGLTVAKVATVVLVASVALIVARRRPRVAVVVTALGVLAGIVGGFSNTATLVLF
jgi:uncharacterized membrane protein (UPF0136 family)